MGKRATKSDPTSKMANGEYASDHLAQSNRLTSATLTAGGAIFVRLKQLGVEYVFVNSGTDFPPIIEGLAEADAKGIDLPKPLVIPHEHAALGMAYGYYFASGQAQAVMMHTNVGLSNGITGAINAANEHVPILLMSGRTPTTEKGRFGSRTTPIGWGQEMRDQTGMIRELCKWDYELRFPEQMTELLDRGYAIANSTPKGPIYLSLPREVLCEETPGEMLAAPIQLTPSQIGPNRDQIARLAELLARAERPLIIAQRGAGSEAGFAALARLTEKWSIPVNQYFCNRLALSAEHPSYIGQRSHPWLSEADLILVLDSLVPWEPGKNSPDPTATIVQLGPDPIFSGTPIRNFRSDLTLTSEVDVALLALEAALDELDGVYDETASLRSARQALMVERMAGYRTAVHEAATPRADGRMTKMVVGEALRAALSGKKATIFSELGCPFDSIGPTEHNSWFQVPHSGALGWSLPAALGYKLADRSQLVIATMGDGSYIFANPLACHQIGEAYDIPILTVILNNAGWGAVKRSVTSMYPDGYAARADKMPLAEIDPTPNFAQAAEACGVYAETVLRVDTLSAAIERALHVVVSEKRQAMLDVHVVD